MFDCKYNCVMGNKTSFERGENSDYYCYVSDVMDDPLAELADIVGKQQTLRMSGSVLSEKKALNAQRQSAAVNTRGQVAPTANPEQMPQQRSSVASPLLGQDFEDELSKSLNDVFAPQGTPPQAPEQKAAVSNADDDEVFDNAPRMDFSSMIADELDRAFKQADETPQQAPQAQAAEQADFIRPQAPQIRARNEAEKAEFDALDAAPTAPLGPQIKQTSQNIFTQQPVVSQNEASYSETVQATDDDQDVDYEMELSRLLSEEVASFEYEALETKSSVQQPAAPQVQQQAAPQVQQSAAPQVQQSAAPQVQQSAAPQVQQQAAPHVQQSAAPQVQQSAAPQAPLMPQPMIFAKEAPQVMDAPVIPEQEKVAPQFNTQVQWEAPQTKDFDANINTPSVGFGEQAYDDGRAAGAQPHFNQQNTADIFAQPAAVEPKAEEYVFDTAPSAHQIAQPSSQRPDPLSDSLPDPLYVDDFNHIDDDISIPTADLAHREINKNKTGKRAAFALIAVAFLGGSVVLGSQYMSSNSGPVPTILASQDAVKVKPTKTGGEVVPNQDLAVYNDVDGAISNTPKQESLKDNSEKPIEVAKQKTNTTEQDSLNQVSARRVRTVVVKPDGTILSASNDTDLNITGATVKNAAPKLTQSATTKATQNATKAADKLAAASETKVAKLITKAPKVPVKKLNTPKAKPVSLPKKAAPVAQKVEPKAVAQESYPTVSSAYAVQVSSQRSVAAAKASYANLLRRYNNVIGGKGLDIREAKIAGKGSFFRVRIPAKTKAEARKICNQLKSKGGDCFVTR